MDLIVLYVLGEYKDCVFYKYLEVDFFYNMYKVKGLFLGLIVSSGLMLIKVVLYLVNIDYLYFLVIFEGKVIFIKMLEEYNKEKVKYIIGKEK